MEDTRGIGRAIRYYRSLRRPEGDVSPSVGRRLASSVDGLDSTGAKRVLERATTLGSAVKLRQRLRNVPSGTLGALSDRGTQRFRRYLQRTRSGSGSNSGLEVLTDGGRDNFVSDLNELPGEVDVGETFGKLQRRLSGEKYKRFFGADLPGQTRRNIIEAIDEGNLEASNAAKVAGELADNPGVRERIIDLDVAERGRAYRLIADSSEDVTELLSEIDPNSVEEFLSLNTGEADAFREKIARGFSSGGLSKRQTEQIIEDVRLLEEYENSIGDTTDIHLADGLIKDFARAGETSNLEGAAFEARYAAQQLQEGNGIDTLGETFILPDDRRVELDTIKSNGNLAEVKGEDFTEVADSDVNDLREQIEDGYIRYRSDDSEKVTVVFSDPIEEIDQDVLDMIDRLNNQYGNIDYDYEPTIDTE